MRHVLSAAESDSDWSGLQGQLSDDIFDQFVPSSSIDHSTLLCVCGPTPFTQQFLRFIYCLVPVTTLWVFHSNRVYRAPIITIIYFFIVFVLISFSFLFSFIYFSFYFSLSYLFIFIYLFTYFFLSLFIYLVIHSFFCLFLFIYLFLLVGWLIDSFMLLIIN